MLLSSLSFVIFLHPSIYIIITFVLVDVLNLIVK